MDEVQPIETSKTELRAILKTKREIGAGYRAEITKMKEQKKILAKEIKEIKEKLKVKKEAT
jgi:hypothetical protein